LPEKIKKLFQNRPTILKIIAWKEKAADICQKIINSGLIIPLALFGLAAIAITGALGGAIVYGPNIDPFVAFIIKILGL